VRELLKCITQNVSNLSLKINRFTSNRAIFSSTQPQTYKVVKTRTKPEPYRYSNNRPEGIKHFPHAKIRGES